VVFHCYVSLPEGAQFVRGLFTVKPHEKDGSRNLKHSGFHGVCKVSHLCR